MNTAINTDYTQTREVPSTESWVDGGAEHTVGKSREMLAVRDLIDYESIKQKAVELLQSRQPVEKALMKNEAVDNARTALFEGLTKSGHLSHIEFDGHANDVHRQILQRLLNGFDETLPFWEQQRRFYELCEELAKGELFEMAIAGQIPTDIHIDTISDFPHEAGEEASRWGYRADNKKGMVRSEFLIPDGMGGYRRVLEQISRSNTDAAISIAALQEEGVNVDVDAPTYDVQLLATPVVRFARDGEIGALSLMKRLDAYAGQFVRYGEPISTQTISYEHLHTVSRAREDKMQFYIEKLAHLETELDKRKRNNDITDEEWAQLYQSACHRYIREICIENPEYVADTLGSGVVKVAYDKAHQLYLQGDMEGAAQAISTVAAEENEVVICGGSRSNTVSSPDSVDDISQIRKELEQRKESWKWTDGYCRTQRCEYQSKRTKVGPCDVCMKCQMIYDAQQDPSEVYRKAEVDVARSNIYKSYELAADNEADSAFKEDMIKRKFGTYATLTSRHIIGGMKTEVVDSRTNKVIAEV